MLPPAKNRPVFAVLWTHLKVADFEDGGCEGSGLEAMLTATGIEPAQPM